MKETIISVTAIICLTILGIFIATYIPGASKALYAIVVVIGGLGGYEIGKVIKGRISKRKQNARNR